VGVQVPLRAQVPGDHLIPGFSLHSAHHFWMKIRRAGVKARFAVVTLKGRTYPFG